MKPDFGDSTRLYWTVTKQKKKKRGKKGKGNFKQCFNSAFHFLRKQLEDILNNMKEKPDVGTLLLVSHICNFYR